MSENNSEWQESDGPEMATETIQPTPAETIKTADEIPSQPAPAAEAATGSLPGQMQSAAPAGDTLESLDAAPDSPKWKSWPFVVSVRRWLHNRKPEAKFGTPEFDAEIAKLARLKEKTVAAANALEQPPRAPEMVRPIYDQERNATRPASRAAEIALIESAFAAGAFDGPLTLRPDINPFIASVFLDDTQKTPRYLAFQLRKMIATYRKNFLESARKLSPTDWLAELKIELSTPNLSANDISRISAEMALAESSSAEIVADRTNAALIAEYQPVKELIIMLASAIADTLRIRLNYAIAAESYLFERFNLPREETAVSRQYAGPINDLETQIGRINVMQSHGRNRPPHPSHLSAFGVEIVPGLD